MDDLIPIIVFTLTVTALCAQNRNQKSLKVLLCNTFKDPLP